MDNKLKKNLLWLLLLAAISLLTILLVTKSSDGFTWRGFSLLLGKAEPLCLVLAVLSAFGYVYFEGAAIGCTCRFFSQPYSASGGLLFSASDIFFSAITPSATGGQPAALMFMLGSGISGAVSALALLLNLVMYTAAILIIGAVCFAVHPEIFLALGAGPQLFVAAGIAVQLAFIALFVMCIINERLAGSVCRWGLRLLCRIKLLRDYEGKEAKLLSTIEQYGGCGARLMHETGLLLKVFALNLAQRLSIIFVAVFVYIGTGGDTSDWFKVFSVQALAVLGSNAVPVPGAVGVSDFILLRGFAQLSADPVGIELLTRGISFYAMVIFCALVMLVHLAGGGLLYKRGVRA